jgi:hypothetical protein
MMLEGKAVGAKLPLAIGIPSLSVGIVNGDVSLRAGGAGWIMPPEPAAKRAGRLVPHRPSHSQRQTRARRAIVLDQL